jgi:PAS domain S-box-containing protein
MDQKPGSRSPTDKRVGPLNLGAPDVLAIIYAVSFYIWLLLRTPGTAVTEFVGALAFYPLGLAVAWASWSNSRLPGLDRATRLAWQLFAAAALVLFVGGNLSDVLSRFSGTRMEPDWIGNFRTAHGVALMAACLALPVRRFAGRSRARAVLDATLVVFAGLAIALYYGLKLWARFPYYESIPTAVAGHALDCAVFVLATVGSIRKRDRGSRAALVCWALAVTTYLAANYALVAGTAGPGSSPYRPGDPVDGLWFGAWAFRWLAARVSRYMYERDRAKPEPAASVIVSEYESRKFPYLVVAGTFLLLVGRIFAHDPQFLYVLAVSTAVMFTLLVIRQIVELQENDRLFARQIAQEARFQSLVQRSSDIMLVVDSGGTIEYASPAAASVFGDDSPLRAGSRLIDVVREDDRALVGPLLTAGHGARRAVVHLPAPQGEWREIEALSTELRHDPSVGAFVINCRDITIRSELARQLRHTQRLDAVGRLADGLAHDVNNSLTIVRGVADLLDAEIPRGLPASEDLAHIRQAVDRAGHLTRRVLAFSRRRPARHEVIDINVLVQGLVPVLRQAVTPRVDVRLTLASDLWTVRADPGQLEQVLVNLATNARDAMPGGGTLAVITSNRKMEASPPEAGSPPAGEYVSVEVADRGIGMAPEVLGRIFDPFFSTKAQGAGMGLGLAMVREIIRDIGGWVLVESRLGHGSTFTLLLPRSLEMVAAVEEQAGEAGASARPALAQTVLLVDDETYVRDVTRRILERHGYRVVEAEGGRQALVILDDPSAEFDVVLTDIVMPGVHGRQVIARSGELRPSVPVVCMTGFSGEREDLRQYGANVVEILFKPFTSDALVRAIAAALGARGVA